MKTKELSLVKTTQLDIPKMEIIKDGEIEKLKGGFAIASVASVEDETYSADINSCGNNHNCHITDSKQ